MQKYLQIIQANHNNLKDISAKFPIGKLTVVTGVSGSGKSSLIFDTLYPAIKNKIYKTNDFVGNYKQINNLDYFDQVIHIDQSPIGTTPRSIPATYINILSDIRILFSKTIEAKKRGFKLGHFSFNTKQGQCPKCTGKGIINVEMLFMPNLEIICETCNGQRYKQEILDVDYLGKNISQVLNLTISEAVNYFEKFPIIKKKLQLLCDVGLDYLSLGQSSTTLSGGESQRLKIAKELSKNQKDHTLYLLDEPSIGLHPADVFKLIKTLRKLIEKNATIILVEHDPDLILEADYILDLGPDGGPNGGEVIYQGDLKGLLKCENSYTGKCLKQSIKQ